MIRLQVDKEKVSGKTKWQGVRYTEITDEGVFYKKLWTKCHEVFKTLYVDIEYERLADDHPMVVYYLGLLHRTGRQRPVLFPHSYLKG